MADAFNNSIDIKENYIYQLDKSILEILLKDHSSGKNILWATDMYAWRGVGYQPQDYITVKAVTGLFGNVIKPRIKKSQKEQRQRIKTKAEVFTPSWICNRMANALDATWFGRDDVFNTEQKQAWIASTSKISFPLGKTWHDYVNLKVLEITCGEAPFLASRYDTVTGKWLEVNERIGLLDRKLRIVSENITDESEWVQWAYQAYKSTYGYEWLGDSVLIARENLLFTFIDFYTHKFNCFPVKHYLIELSKIIAWNIWQMDGLKNTVPNYAKPTLTLQMSFLDDEQQNNLVDVNNADDDLNVYCKIKNWQANRTIKFDNIKTTADNHKGENKMKFDFVIGNPPYQESDGGGTGDSAKPVYHFFINEAKNIVSESFSLVVPSRWMKGGKGLEGFRQDMMLDTRVVSIFDFEDASECFQGVHIDGGVCYLVWKKNYNGEVHFIYKPKNEDSIDSYRFLKTDYSNTVIRDYRQSSIIQKTSNTIKFSEIVSYRNPYGLSADLFNEIDKHSDLDVDFHCAENKVKVFGVVGKKGGAKRVVGFISRDNIKKNSANIDKYKLFFSKAYMTTSTVPPEIIVGDTNCVCTETFLEIGTFNSRIENENCLSYIKSKFFRALLFYNRHSLNISKESFSLIPIQDFTEKSDIDWTKSIAEIDRKLYEKYDLTADEINFIETHIKEMD